MTNKACKYSECEWQRALYSLTVGGSEFVDEPETCRRYAQGKLNELHEARKTIVKLRRELQEMKLWTLNTTT